MRKGFTLIELLLVVVIIGIMAAIVVPRLAGRSKDAQIAATKDQLTKFRTALGVYNVDTKDYPTTDQWKAGALITAPNPTPKGWNGPYLEAREMPKDPWGNEYLYQYPGAINPKMYDLKSAGPDGQMGNEDDIDVYGTSTSDQK